MLLDVDTSGSPFKLLPPPPEKEEEGFKADQGFAPLAGAAEGQTAGSEQLQEEMPVPEAAIVVEPASLPPLPAPARHRQLVVKVVAALVAAAVLARLWHGTVRSDWAAAGIFAAAAAAFCIAQAGWRPWLRGAVAALALAGMAAAFYRFGAGAFAWPAQTPDLEVFILSGLGLAAAWAGFYLGVWTLDRMAAAGLTAGSGALLFLAALSLLLPPEAAWLHGVRAIAVLQGRQLAASGGLWRWGALLALALAGLALWRRQSLVRRAAKGPLMNWNR